MSYNTKELDQIRRFGIMDKKNREDANAPIILFRSSICVSCLGFSLAQ